MKALYIGQFSDGTTSKMRAETIKKVISADTFLVIDTHVPFFKTNKILRSFGFRFKRGPLIKNINKYILQSLSDTTFDLIWVDKGVYINSNTIKKLRSRASKLVHFTPDPAFAYHQSKLFNSSVKYYDYLITTKSFELQEYYKRKNKSQVIYVTQGFDKNLHKKGQLDFSKKSGLLFIGHYEKTRELIIKNLIEDGVKVTLAGIKWAKFYDDYKSYENLVYLGNGVYGNDYVKSIQNAQIAWGAISKWIPEKHTTRTFEIPACGTALLTEENEETNSFFMRDEVIFYNNTDELLNKVNKYLKDMDALETLSNKGYNRVHKDGYDYESIIKKLITIILE